MNEYFQYLFLKNFNNGCLGGNYICNGKASGEEYFEHVLSPLIKDNFSDIHKTTIYIIADDTFGVPMIFLRTVIELCIETYGIDFIEHRIKFKDFENPYQEKLGLEIIKNTIKFYKTKEKGYKHPDNLEYCKRYNLDKNTKTYE